MSSKFEWDEANNRENQQKHGISFEEARIAFSDPHRLLIKDTTHSTDHEVRWFCVGYTGKGIATVRFTYRGLKVRIFGAGYWRKMRKQYYQQKEQS